MLCRSLILSPRGAVRLKETYFFSAILYGCIIVFGRAVSRKMYFYRIFKAFSDVHTCKAVVHGWCDVGDFCFWGEVGGEVDEFPLQRN